LSSSLAGSPALAAPSPAGSGAPPTSSTPNKFCVRMTIRLTRVVLLAILSAVAADPPGGEGGIQPDWEARLEEISRGCGQVCDTSIEGATPSSLARRGPSRARGTLISGGPGERSLFFSRISKEVDCAGLWGNAAIDAARPRGAAPDIPDALREHFTYGGRVPVHYWPEFFNEHYVDSDALVGPRPAGARPAAGPRAG